ncbi:endonuclease [Isoalcanivorax indicus]|uniref:endonuclease n=1 Tax=Isoalcanivorax indicus TaxID=2202653 RepID=UPI0013C4737C|nr:endonuclease [Isoalcanivorax indicus]
MHTLAIRNTAHALAALGLTLAVSSVSADSAEDQLINEVYADGGHTLYCGTSFMPGDRVRIDRIYPDRQLQQEFGCSSNRICQNDPGYAAARDDLHQMFPIERQSEIDRRATLFGELRSGVPTSQRCDYRLGFQTFEPGDAAKGAVARAMMYMHVQHGLPLVGTYEMLQRWNETTPPDEAERARNARISELTGRRNPFIDDPASMREVPAPALF